MTINKDLTVSIVPIKKIIDESYTELNAASKEEPDSIYKKTAGKLISQLKSSGIDDEETLDSDEKELTTLLQNAFTDPHNQTVSLKVDDAFYQLKRLFSTINFISSPVNAQMSSSPFTLLNQYADNTSRNQLTPSGE